MPSFIVTMATQMIGSGLAVVYTGARPSQACPPPLRRWGPKYTGHPFALILGLVVAVITTLSAAALCTAGSFTQ